MLSAATDVLYHTGVKYLREETVLAFHHRLDVPFRPVYQAVPKEPLQPHGLCAGSDPNRVLAAAQQTFLQTLCSGV